jgi:hypothetical protein
MSKITTTQPSNLNQFNAVSFEVSISRLPNVEFFCQRIAIPSVVLGEAFQPMPFMNLPVEGDTLTFEPLNLSFILDEDMQNYLEVYNWMTALGFPREYGQFATLKEASEASEYSSMFSDMTIMLLTNKSNPNYQVNFTDAFPTSLSSIQLDTTQAGLDPIIVDVTFNFKGMFDIVKVI